MRYHVKPTRLENISQSNKFKCWGNYRPNKFKCWEDYRVKRTVTVAGGEDVVTTIFRETLAFPNDFGAMHT